MLFIGVFLKREYPGNIKPEVNSSGLPPASRFGNKRFLCHSRRVGEVQLKHVPAGFDVEPHGKRRRKVLGGLSRQDPKILQVHGHPSRQLYASRKPQRPHIMLIDRPRYEVAMNERGTQLYRYPRVQFSCHNQLKRVIHPRCEEIILMLARELHARDG